MRLAVGSDHRGFQLKKKLVDLLTSKGHEVLDEGTYDNQSVDYPDFASIVCDKVGRGEVDRGVLICGTGIGMAITANKFPRIRAATCYDETTAEMSRRHNDVNVLCLSADLIGERTLNRVVDIWLNTEFEAGRHARRIKKIHDFEQRHATNKDS